MKKDMISHWLPCPVVFVGAEHEGKRDIMTATAMFVSEKEPLFVVSLASGHLTARLIEASGAFVITLASEAQRDLALQLGGTRGNEEDKLKRFGVRSEPGESVPDLVPRNCAGWMACEVIGRQEIPGYTMFVGRVTREGRMAGKPLVWRQDAFYGLTAL